MNAVTQTDLEHLISGCGYVEWDDRTIIELAGADSRSFLHRFCTQDLEQIEPGRGCEAFLTTVRGKTLAHVLVSVLADSVVLETVAGQAATIMPHLDRYVLSERVQLIDRTNDWAQWLLAGTGWTTRLAECAGPIPDATGASVTMQLDDATAQIIVAPFAGAPCIVLRAERSSAAAVNSVLAKLDATPCQRASLEWRRIQNGFPWYGQDFDASNLPQELDRNDAAISFTKGCYLGQETVARLDAVGHVNKLLRGVVLEPSKTPVAACDVQLGEKIVGRLTSSATNGDRTIGMGILRYEASLPGTDVTVNGVPGVVSEFPLR